ncbi:MAG: glutamate synthase subunit beta [Desulfobacterales bacterium]
MGKPTGFMEFDRELPEKRPVKDRVKDFSEIYRPFSEETLKSQAARCMDCGVPTCHAGCPLGNRIPDWNDRVYHGHWRSALDQLHATNNFPEFTGRLCPAPCEEACVLSINEQPVTIEQIEKEIIEHGFGEGWVQPRPPRHRTGKSIAVVGSGPAGLACAQQLNRAGHVVTVFERDDRIGGLLRYGIPDFKLEKQVLDRRLALMTQEGIDFRPGVNIGLNLSTDELSGFDAVVLCCGATRSRDLNVPGRELNGIYFAMDFLRRQNRLVAGDIIARHDGLNAKGKDVIVIGGGDTGSDCIGTCRRQQAKSVTNFELMPQPVLERPDHQPWPFWPVRLRTSSSHEEGCYRHWSILTKKFAGKADWVEKLVTVDVAYSGGESGHSSMREVHGSEREWPADLVLLALGFTGPEPDTVVAQFDLRLDARGNIETDSNHMTSRPAVFAAGDARRGQSLIVWAISEGREAARSVDTYLMGRSKLPTKGCCDLPRV